MLRREFKAAMNIEIKKRIAQITMLAMDVDGVMTDGRTFCDGTGNEGMFFNVHDGSAIKWLHRAGFQTAIISGRDTGALQSRVATLSIPYVFKGIKVKMEAYNELKKQSGLDDCRIAYVGDDLHDLPVLRKVGLACSVNNARTEVKNQSHIVTRAAGGYGAIREIAEMLLKQKNKWDKVTGRYFVDW